MTPPPNPVGGWRPGSFGCHEALHMAHVLVDMVEDRLCEHPAIKAAPAWATLAERARDMLFELYQAIAAAVEQAGKEARA